MIKASERLSQSLPEPLRDRQPAWEITEEGSLAKLETKDPPKEEKIPFNEIRDHFISKHCEFRKISKQEAEELWVYPIQNKMIKNLLALYKSKERLFEATEALILYLKDGKDKFNRTLPIFPTSLSNGMRPLISPYWKKQMPKLEIKQYENKGVYIGPMPEGW